MKNVSVSILCVAFAIVGSCGLPPKIETTLTTEPTTEQLKAILVTRLKRSFNVVSATVKRGPSNEPACALENSGNCGCLGNLSFKIPNGRVAEGACCFAVSSLDGESKPNSVSYFSCKDTEVCGTTQDGIGCQSR